MFTYSKSVPVTSDIQIPEKHVRMSFPVSHGRQAELFFPAPMTQEEWARLEQAFVMAKDSIVNRGE